MKLGFSLPVAGARGTPESQLRVARQAEALGYHSLWVFQRLLYPLAPQNDDPPMPGQPWPRSFEANFDPAGPDLDRVLGVMEALAPGRPAA